MQEHRRKPAGAHKPWVLKLYVTGVTQRSRRAITNLKAICEEYLQGNYDLEVVDVYQAPALARRAKVIAAPILVKELPLPPRRLIGDLSDRGRLLMFLNLKAPNANTK